MLSLSIPELLSILLDIVITIVKIGLIFAIAWLSSRLFLWIWRSLVIPIFQRRAYFYEFKGDGGGFYVEKPLRLLWIRLWRNKRWALQKSLVGYVSQRRGSTGADPIQDNIYFMDFFGKTLVGQVKSAKERQENGRAGKITKCEVILKRTNLEGDTYYDTPIGFINDKGEVYKYYKNRRSALKGEKLEQPELIGYARAPQLVEKKSYSGSFDTDEKAASEGINDTEEVNEWFFFRKRKKSKVRAQKISSPATNKGYIALWTAGWRVLHAHLIDTNPERKLTPWGVGYAKEDFWRNLFTKDVDGFSLDARAVAALLLAEKEGFYLREGEQGADGDKSMAPTALLSLVCYLCAFPFLGQWSALERWFKAFGPQISKVISLILLFFGIWLIIHIIRLICYDATNRFESFLSKMNNNVGTTNWNTELIVTSVIGLILSLFVVDYMFFPIFFCALVAVIVNRVVFPSVPWDVEYPIDDSEDETSDENNENQEEEEDSDERIEHKAQVFTMGNNCELKFSIPFKNAGLKSLRAENPFRNGNTSEYSLRVHDMINREYGGKVYSKIKYVKDKIDSFAAKHHLSYMEKVNLILKLAQPNNIRYEYDSCCPELLPQMDEPAPNPALLENRRDGGEGKGYIEYCRFPTETLHDQRGDCDCHAALAVGLLAACGIRCCYFTNKTNDGTGHAAFGIEVNKETQSFLTNNNSFTYQGITFIYTEATGTCCLVGEVPEEFQRMLERGDDYAVIEPANFIEDMSHEK